MSEPLHVGVELGGTKVIVAGSRHGRTLIGRTRVDTTDPGATLSSVRRAIDALGTLGEIAGIGIGTFGPVDLRKGSSAYGTLVRTPKPGWSGVDVVSPLRPTPTTPVELDTDVDAALLGEVRWGAAGASTAAYLTVGTGIGGGIWVDDRIVHGMNHAEIGHVPVEAAVDDDFAGICPYHGGCLEGMASGPALRARFGARVETLDGEGRRHATALVAQYVAQGVRALSSVVPLECVVIGGGVSHLPGFHAAVAETLAAQASGYPPVPFGEGGPRIVPPGLGDDAGVVGAIELSRSGSAGEVARG